MNRNLFASQRTRAWIYRIALAVSALLVTLGYLTEQVAADLAILIAAILGVGAEALATVNTSTKKDGYQL